MEIYSAVVSQVVPVGFADLGQAADALPGAQFEEGRARLEIHGRAGTGFVGAVRFSASLHTGSPLSRSIKVEVVVSPWSAGRSEVAIHPLTSLGRLDSVRADRFFKAARSVLPVVVDRLSSDLPVEAPAVLEPAA